ncbi:ribonucleases P/MRP protein subunit POP1-domain-containing protein [Microdochium bolleyi]|uniref:Ribonucleases P/MRP protein subunit POP1-domain-containing protein n=1 Tax=Microdochium bolleyi TaxID=196109 RepID=A0A136J9F3_9PEZI|nr:ribonucleases P/MRP protein subunit POP1-domain-containing protein [Microdochium bolleyi]
MGPGTNNKNSNEPRAQERKRPPQGSLEATAPKRAKSHNGTSTHKAVPIHHKKGVPRSTPSGTSTPTAQKKGHNGGGGPPNGRPGARPNMRDVRAIAVSKADPAVQDGQLNVQSFLDARSFELKALTESMRRTKASSTSRAFQIVPITLRRRTAAHNHKRVPKRLQPRAKREMKQDNTPTVNSKTRKPGSTRNRLRAENARKLGLLARRKKLLKLKTNPAGDNRTISLRAARPKIRRNTLNDPVVTNRKFRRRQIHKTWLPTHLWHTKRARMTEPSKPLWRFAIPLTPSNKSYRPTHRAQFERGAMAWDMSFISTIGLAGRLSGVRNVLKGLGLNQDSLWNDRGARWRTGAVHWSGLLKKQSNSKTSVLAPTTIVWSPAVEFEDEDVEKQQRRLFLRVHPSVFLETFNEILRLARTNNPQPYVEDLRYEIGAIDLVGPSSTEALMAVFKPHASDATHPLAQKFQSLTGLKDPASLPLGSMFAFSAVDPRLSYPYQPRRVAPAEPFGAQQHGNLYEILSAFHQEPARSEMALFDRDARFKASQLPSQKSINRRKTKGAPGAPLKVTSDDPPLPILALASRHLTDPQSPGSWTVLLPWKCVLPFWYCLMHYPLSTGGNPQFGGQDELRQLSFERGLPWFPGDVPGTEAGNAWELEQRDLRLKKWQRMPKGKRHNYETLNLGGGRKGEIGDGWSCAYEKLFRGKVPQDEPEPSTGNKDVDMADAENCEKEKAVTAAPSNPLADISYIPKSTFSNLLKQVPATPMPPRTLVTVRIRMITKGTPISCARIYRLPTGGPELLQTSQEHDPSSMDVDRTSQATVADVPASIPLPGQQQPSRSLVPAPADLYEQWLSLLPHHKNKQHHQPQQQQPSNSIRKNTPLTVEDRQRLIAQQLIAPVLALNGSGAAPSASAAFFPPHSAPPGSAPPPASSLLSTGHPMCPDEHDLIGFVTKGEFNLRDGRGEGIASLSAVMAAEELRRYHGTNTTTTEEEQEDVDDKEAQKMKNGKKRRKTKPPAKAKADMRNSVATRLCVVRNAGEDVGRLARWELVGL